jgi:hypothetical protein
MIDQFLVYKTVHVPTNRFYIGRHVTNDIDDGYFGSGTIISRLLKKHPKEDFNRVILLKAESSEDMLKAENRFIEEFLDDPLCLNLIQGDPRVSGIIRHSIKSKQKISKSLTGHKAWNKGIKVTDEVKEKISAALTGRSATQGFIGNTHSIESKLKMKGKRDVTREDMKGNINLKTATKNSWAPGGARRIAQDRKATNG